MHRRWIVDASNVFGSRPDGWWRDRPRALHRLLDEIVRWHDELGEPVLLVADGYPSPWVPEGTHAGVHVVYAHSSARDAADDTIARIVDDHHDPATLTVVSSDRGLCDRVERSGAATEGAGRFLDRIADTDARRSDRELLHRFGIDESALLGRGGEARVYALDDEHVLRLPHPGTSRRAVDDRSRLLDVIGRGRSTAPFSVPRVIRTEDVAGRRIVIEERLPGRPAIEVLDARATDREALVRSHLDAASAIADLPCGTDRYGELLGAAPIQRDSFDAWATARLEVSLRAAAGAFAHLDAARLTADLVAALPPDAGPVLVHLDAFLGNMLATDDAVTAVVDFGPTTIGGPVGLDPAVAVAYLAPEITPSATDSDRAAARRWAAEHGLGDAIEPAERWIAAYWTGAPEDERLQRWCRRILGAPDGRRSGI